MQLLPIEELAAIHEALTEVERHEVAGLVIITGHHPEHGRVLLIISFGRSEGVMMVA